MLQLFARPPRRPPRPSDLLLLLPGRARPPPAAAAACALDRPSLFGTRGHSPRFLSQTAAASKRASTPWRDPLWLRSRSRSQQGTPRHAAPLLRQRRPYHARPPEPPDPQERLAERLRTAEPLVRWRGWRALNTPSTYTVAFAAAAAAVVFYFANLETVPVSGRTRFNVYGPASVRRVGEAEFRRVLWELERKGLRILPAWDPRAERVRRVMARLLPFSGMMRRDGGGGGAEEEEVEEEDWEVFVVDEPRTANAFVLPGGKVFVYSGILGLAGNDSGLATVLSHEIAHNLAGHLAERLSHDIPTSIALYSMVLLGPVFGLATLLQFLGFGVVDVAFGLPMNRMQESEADFIGLMMMAEACYDPHEAVRFWARMERATKGQEVPEWMSTHPTNTNRIKKIQEWMPKALEKRAQSDCRTTTAFADLFRQALRTGQVIVW